MDLSPVIRAVREDLADLSAPVSVAIMGCVVNGPGEAEGADVALCAGKDKALLYQFGRKVRTVRTDQMVAAVCDLARRVAAEMAGAPPVGQVPEGRKEA
jgi:(E)-4-hydroxy-3-methylbut-2-enyl-diphosphate synthase